MGTDVVDSWDIFKAIDGPTNHFFESDSLADIRTGLGQLYTQLGDANFQSLTGGTSTGLGGVTGATGGTGGTFTLTSNKQAEIWGIKWDNRSLP